MRQTGRWVVACVSVALAIMLCAVPLSEGVKAAPKQPGPDLAVAPKAPRDWQDSVRSSKGVSVDVRIPSASPLGVRSCLPDWVLGGADLPLELTIMGFKRTQMMTVWVQSHGNGSPATRGQWQKFEVMPQNKFGRDLYVTVRPVALNHETQLFIRVNDPRGRWAETSVRLNVKAECPDCAPGVPVQDFIPDFDSEGREMAFPDSLLDLPDLPLGSEVLNRSGEVPFVASSEFLVNVFLPDGSVPAKFLCRYYLRALEAGWQAVHVPPMSWMEEPLPNILLRRSPWWLSLSAGTWNGRPTFSLHGCYSCYR